MQRDFLVFFALLVVAVVAPDTCGPNTMSLPCGNPCQDTCGQLKPRWCPDICIVNGCVCKPGYIRRDENGPCIPKKWCLIAAEEWNWIEEVPFGKTPRTKPWIA